jgi:hypothetical protein
VLDGEPRVTELARMLGGDPESEVSRAHARELLESAASGPGSSESSPPPRRQSARRSR